MTNASEIISLLSSTEITKDNVNKILAENNISISQNDLIELLYDHLRKTGSKYIVSQEKVIRKISSYKQYLNTEFSSSNVKVQEKKLFYKNYYKSRVQFVNELDNNISMNNNCDDRTNEFNNCQCKNKTKNIGCELHLYTSNNGILSKNSNPVIVDITGNSRKEYDTNIIYALQHLLSQDNDNYHIIPGLSLKYWKLTDTITTIPIKKIKNNSVVKTPVINDDILNEKWEKRYNQFIALSRIKFPEQRSPEWFEQRKTSITASACGTILGRDKYNSPYKFLEEKISPTFKPNINCYHGTKYEEIAKIIYEEMYDVKVREFGLLKHPTHDLIAASPDGICSDKKKDGVSKTNMVGRMVEIKCPTTREIIKSDNVEEVVPPHYYDQIQQQLSCCSLDECDFFQCKISEYDTYDNFINDSCPDKNYISKKTGLYKGCLIQLLPISSFDKDDINMEIYGKAKFLYPKDVLMTNTNYIKWICKMISKKSFVGYSVHKIIYWRLEMFHNITVPIEKLWLSKSITVFTKVWKYITLFRNYPETFEKYKEYKNGLLKTVKYMKLASGYYHSQILKDSFNDKLMQYVHQLYTNQLRSKKKDE